MSKSGSPLGLSERGQLWASGNNTSQVFEILQNLWHPTENPDGYVSLGVAENDIMHDKMVAYMEKTFRVPHEYLTYHDGGNGSRRLRQAVARFLTRHLHPAKPFEARHVIVTNGCSSAVECLSFVLADPGDCFLLGQPHYMTFIPDIEMRSGTKVIRVAFDDVDPMGMAAVTKYEETIKRSQAQNHKIKALILCHPHNPLGRCYPKEVIIELMRLCQKYRIHLVSDEIYALSTWENKEDTSPAPVPFVSASSIDTTDIIDAHLVHIVWGMSKDFGANGIRIGCAISPANPDLISSMATASLYTFPSTISDHITATILEDDVFTDAYIRENQAALSRRYFMAVRVLRQHDIAYAPGANAAFFICVDLASAYRARHPQTPADDGEDVTELIMRKLLEKKVFIIDSAAIGSEKPGWFRIVFSQYEEYLVEGLKRIVAAIEDGGSAHGGVGAVGGSHVTTADVNGADVPLRTKPVSESGANAGSVVLES